MTDNVTRFDNPTLSDQGVERPVNVTMVGFRKGEDYMATIDEVASAWCQCQGYEKAVHQEFINDGTPPKGAWRLIPGKLGAFVWKLCNSCDWHITRIDCAGQKGSPAKASFDHDAQQSTF